MAQKQIFKQNQQQTLSPQQLQVIKLLEYPILELEEVVRHELEENMALEEGADTPEAESTDIDSGDDSRESDSSDSGDFDEYTTDDDIPDYRLKDLNYSSDTKHVDIVYSSNESFSENLLGQLGLLSIEDDIKKIAQYIIGNLDEDGYLRREVSQITDDLNVQIGLNIDETVVFEALSVVQELEPAGVGARSLEECLILQLERKAFNDDIDNAMRIVEECFEEFTKKHYDKILSKLKISDSQLKRAIGEIMGLSPKPSNGFNEISLSSGSDIVIPDFIYDGESRLLSLNNKDIPPLRVNQEYVEMFSDYSSNKKNQTAEMKAAVQFTKQKLDKAKSFIDAIRQREHTLLSVMQAILKFQKEYFVDGDESLLKPMTMKDIAGACDCDISTVSRVANSKYIQTDFGVFSLKSFFTEGMTTESGEEVSTREIKKFLSECIENEDKKKPLPDEKLCELLKKEGYPIARRTVAKYREQLGLPVARLRKEL